MSLVADFTGSLFGVVVVRCVGVLVGDGLDDGNGVLVGELLSPLQSGDRFILSMFARVKVRHLVLDLIGSGLSLGHLFPLPFGGLRPKFGSVVILSIFGIMYVPKIVGSVFWYFCFPKFLVQSSTLSVLSLT